MTRNETGGAMGRVWILTDQRYLEQRMPASLIRELERREVVTRVVTANDVVARVGGDATGDDVWAELRAGDVVVARTRNRFGLALLRAAARPGVTVLPCWEAVAHVRNKARAAETLAAGGIPIPRTLLADRPSALKRLPADQFPILLKPHLGDNAIGIVLVRHPVELDELAWPDGLVMAQEFVDSAGVDLKLYGIGDRVWAVRRPSPLTGSRSGFQPAESIDASPELELLARACADTVGLELYGVDVLVSRRGPIVVDVNEFPNYTGVQEAPAAIADLVCACLAVEMSA